MKFVRIGLNLLLGALLCAQVTQAEPAKKPAAHLAQQVAVAANLGDGFNANFAALLPAFGNLAQPSRLEVGKALVWRELDGTVIAQLPLAAELLDWRQRGDEIWLMTMLLPEQQPVLLALNAQSKTLREVARLPLPAFKVENLCLSQDASHALFVYLLDERGSAEHWLLADDSGHAQPRLLRHLPIAPNSKACSVVDKQEQLFITEEAVGIWLHPASPEIKPGRVPVAMHQPFGELRGAVEALATVPGGLLALDSDKRELLLYRQVQSQQPSSPWQLQQRLSLAQLDEPKTLSALFNAQQQQLQVLVGDETSGRQYPLALPWVAPAPVPMVMPIASVKPSVQTQPVARFGDAADDPAIWVNHKNPHQSLVLGTNKQQGLFVYDLQGRELQRFDTGRLNNVDVRQGIRKGKQRVDIAMASNRDDNSISLYEIHPRSGKLVFAASIKTDMKDIYGFCMYQSPQTGDVYAIPNDKSGEFQQIRISAVADATRNNQWQWQGEVVRRFQVQSQPEGCVADDQRQRLFIGEEDTGIWTLAAEPQAPGELQLVMKAGEQLVADVEGLAIYQHPQRPYLVVSSQGNNTYLVLDAVAPYAVRGAFRIDMDAGKGIDAVSETDGLELLSVNFGKAFPQGLLVVQDGHKVMPETPQNFKYVSWEQVRQALDLP